jgi:hypothetical protein
MTKPEDYRVTVGAEEGTPEEEESTSKKRKFDPFGVHKRGDRRNPMLAGQQKAQEEQQGSTRRVKIVGVDIPFGDLFMLGFKLFAVGLVFGIPLSFELMEVSRQ